MTTNHLLHAFGNLCSTAHVMQALALRKGAHKDARDASLMAIDQAALALVPHLQIANSAGGRTALQHTADSAAGRTAFQHAAFSLRPAIVEAWPLAMPNTHNTRGNIISAAERTLFEQASSAAHIQALYTRGWDLRPYIPALIVRAIRSRDADLQDALLGMVATHDNFEWVLDAMKSPKKYAGQDGTFAQAYLTAAVQAHPKQAQDFATRLAWSYHGPGLIVLLLAGVSLRAIATSSLPDMARDQIAALTAHRLLSMFPPGGSGAALWTPSAARDHAAGLLSTNP